MTFLSKKVYNYRINMLNNLMDENDLDGFVVFDANFFQFFSNFHVDVTTWERPIALVIPRKGKPVAILNALSTGHVAFARKRDSLWISDVNIYFEFPLDPRDERSRKDFRQMLVDAISAAGLASAKIGMDSRSTWAKVVKRTHPDVNFTQMIDGARSLRWVKHPEEIAIMKELCGLSDWIQERYFEEIHPGRLVHELDLFIAHKVFQRAPELFPGENFDYRFYTLSGPSSASPHGDGGQVGARIEKGHGLVNVIVPRLNGITIENERTIFCGEPSDLQKRAYDAAMHANLAAVEKMVAGNEVREIDAAARDVISKAGFYKNLLHRTGHGMGLGHEYPEDMPYNARPLIANEVYSVEPGIFIEGLGGFRLDDTVVVGDSAPQVLTTTPRSIEEVTIR